MTFVKRFFFCIAFIFLICTLFSAKIIGTGAQLILKTCYHCQLAYSAVKWEEGQLIFSDLVLFDPNFHTHMDQVSFRFDWRSLPRKLKGHITIDTPHLTIVKERSVPQSKSDWFDFSVSANNGILDWGEKAYFSLDHDACHSQVSLTWNDASALLTLEKGRLEVVLHRFHAALLKQWIPYAEVLDGLVTGRFVIDCEGTPLSAHMRVMSGSIRFAKSYIDGLSGTFSYHQGLGTKWELKGIGKTLGEKPFPFSSFGRGFFKNRWFDSEIRFDESVCKISNDGNWKIEFDSICASETRWFQEGLKIFYPEIATFQIENGVISGKGILGDSFWSAQFQGDRLRVQRDGAIFSCLSANMDLTQEGGSFIIHDQEYDLKFAGMWESWNAEARVGKVHLALHGGWDGEKLPIEIEEGVFADLQFQGKGWIDTHLDAFFAIDGVWQVFQKKIPFSCPFLSKREDLWEFDVRLARKTWDFLRIRGTYDGEQITYHSSSHFLGEPIHFAPCGKGELDLSLNLPWSAIASAGPLFKEWGIDLKKLPKSEKTDLHFQYRSDGIELSAQSDQPSFSFQAKQQGDDWEIKLVSELILSAVVNQQGVIKGESKWKESFETHFEGKMDPSLQFAFSLTNAKLNLASIDLIKLEGMATGGGHLIYNSDGLEADFDFNVGSLIIESFPLENEGQVHFSYSSKEGALLRGLHLHGEFDCIIDLLQYDNRSHWILHNAQIHLPAALLRHKFLQILDKDKDLNFTANLDFAADFSTFICTMREGSIPYDGAYHHIENLDLIWKRGKCKVALHYLNQLFRINLQVDDAIQGRLVLGEEEIPLTIDWEVSDALYVHSIEGAFSGIDASFHAESPNVLVGSAHLNFTSICPLLPLDVAEVFDEIKMGQGYELKGRLKIEKNLPYFKGILTGKAIELFGFQFRTLLAQADLGPKKVRIYDVKISDSAGVMKIDELLIEDQTPWTIAIPNLTILELRPSLLQRPGGTVGPIDPLVVRELKITDFKGLLDDGKTYTGKGQLHFINSYKRGETVFDLPANVLSRIVGLDLDLLIPVVGDLTFEIKDGYFNLLELTNAYSEGKRSQFFLETDPLPRMDLEGNLQIYIKMKQFVLLKITESFLISIDGVLDHPHFKLKKKRFFGLM